jgi:hypothetical protein
MNSAVTARVVPDLVIGVNPSARAAANGLEALIPYALAAAEIET